MMAFKGVRNSWLMQARKCVFASFAASERISAEVAASAAFSARCFDARSARSLRRCLSNRPS